MDFALNREQRDIQGAAAEFARGEFDPDQALGHDRDQTFPRGLRQKAAELGFTGMQVPEDQGGQGLGALDASLVLEAFCREDSGFGTALGLCDLGADLVVRNGREDQKARLLPSLARGEQVLSPAFLEQGRWPARMEAWAEPKGEETRLSGRKDFIPMGLEADVLAVFCRTGEEPPRDVSVFLVGAGQGGLEVTPMGDRLGLRMVPMGAADLDGTTVPGEALLGESGQGRDILRAFLEALGVKIGAMALGTAQGALDRALAYASRREQFGRPVIRFEAVQGRLAEMRLQVESARLLVYRAAWLLDQGRAFSEALLAARIAASRAALTVTSDAVQVHGGYGYMKEGHVERFYRDAKALDLFLETGTAARERLARRMAGTKG